ncbi:hypothetical protein FYF77_04740 [Vibrio cholerae]|nr:hypothetical protein [Vibrio cholerae]EGQ9898960.1 hypothetical protein [Vibrio cholerae]EGR0076755.1 hypothetical protein [Vibrio cholerae]EGR0564517.1 hypothetical protein [Vibrio cholerae]
MEYTTKNDIVQLRQLLAFSSVLENVTANEITLSDCEFLQVAVVVFEFSGMRCLPLRRALWRLCSSHI